MRILLINPITVWKNDQNVAFLKHKNFNDHLGIRYIASNLERDGHIVDIVDGHLEELDFNDIVNKVINTNYDFYGISFVESLIENVLLLAKKIKENHPLSRTFLGGYGATLIWDKFFKNCDDIDVVFFGEGEISVANYINCIACGADWTNVEGLIYKKNGEIIKNATPKLVENLDDLLWPKRDAVYKYGKANMIASRGCYGSCTYCSIVEFYKNCDGPRVRIRDPKKVVAEMEYVVKNCGVHHFDFVDDNFMVTCARNSNWAQEFVNEINKRELNISFGIQARANDIKEDILKILFKGGLRFVSVGIENDVNRVIKLFKTGTNKQIHRNAVNVLKKLGISMYIEMILFEPTTTLEELQENILFLKEIKYWELYTQNPISYSTKLHLYQKTSVVTDMMAYVDVKEEGFHLSYAFKDDRVKRLDQHINEWQKKVENLNSLHHGNIYYEASRNKKFHLGLKAIHLSKDYLERDLEFFEESIVSLKENSGSNLKEISDKHIKIMDHILSEYNDVYEKIFSEPYIVKLKNQEA